jgi:hypothetical protein
MMDERDISLVLRVAQQWPVSRLCIARSDPTLEPFVVPIVQIAARGVIWSPIDGKPKRRGAQPLRLKLVADNPNAALLFDDYQDDWTRLWWIRVAVKAEVTNLTAHPLERDLRESFRSKYPQYHDTPVFVEPATAIRFTVTGISIWAASGRDALESEFPSAGS